MLTGYKATMKRTVYLTDSLVYLTHVYYTPDIMPLNTTLYIC